ncbi:hypothetical protein [Pseudomarimonas arenosa]|uniref:DUF5648 domain-containing protein n=1 Tax=Pseudomarimonas arenosa TaxID=2774145 RepID=A0AAW3ZPN6_9GAMM|nr:hypothetical protein [Pseudomarimonas arenosa]MBD8528135.1 hypothetical protein [Pseudomarimonas arenosa]
MKRLLVALMTLLGLVGVASAQPLNNRPLLVPLYEVYSRQYNDYFYSVDLEQVQIAKSMFGYTGQKVVAHLERRQQSGTQAFKRFYKDWPEYNHFYTTDNSMVEYYNGRQISEVNLVQAEFNYQFEGVEGYIYELPVPGTVALHRLNYWNPTTGNQVHQYTTDNSTVQQLRASGWSYDRIAGYVYSSAQPNWENAAGRHFLLGMRCPGPASNTQPQDTSHACFANGDDATRFRDFFFPTVNIDSVRPAGRSTQVITFNFMSRDFFGIPAQQGGGDHLSFGFRGHLHAHRADVAQFCPFQAPAGQVGPNCTWQRGLGMNLWQQRGAGEPMLTLEAWWVPNTNSWTDVAGSIALRGPSAGYANAFQNFVTYSVSARVTEVGGGPHGVGGILDVEVRNPSGYVVAKGSWDTRNQTGAINGAQGLPFTAASPFPSGLNGLFMASANEARRDYTVFITNLKIRWQ